MDKNGSASMVAGLVVGLAAGVALGLILAPKEGRETREMVRQAIESGADRVRRRNAGDS